MPPGAPVIVPEPRPSFRTARLNDWSANDAVTFLTASMVTVQAPVPEQAPAQPVKVEGASGAAGGGGGGGGGQGPARVELRRARRPTADPAGAGGDPAGAVAGLRDGQQLHA